MAWQLLDRHYTIGTVDGGGDITPGPAQTGFQDFTDLTVGNTTYITATQGASWSYMTVLKVGAILRPQVTHASSSGSPITFDSGLPITVFSDLGAEHIVYNDGNGAAQNADPIYLTFSPPDLATLKTTPLPATGKSVRLLRGIIDGDQKGAIYVWDPAEATAGDDFNYVVSALSATGRWVRQQQIVQLPTLSLDSDAYSGGMYKIADEIREKSATGIIKAIPRVENYYQASYATFAAFKAAASAQWVQGDLIEIRGILADGDLNAPLIGVWEASSTNTTNLDYQFLRPDDISGSNPGRLSFSVPVRGVKFPNSDATPSIKTSQLWIGADTPAALITAFDDMKDGSHIWVEPGSAAMTFGHTGLGSHDATHNFVLPDDADFTLETTGASIQFYKENGVIRMMGGGGGSTGAAILASQIFS